MRGAVRWEMAICSKPRRPGTSDCFFFKVVDPVDAVVPEKSDVKPVCCRERLSHYSAWSEAKIAFGKRAS